MTRGVHVTKGPDGGANGSGGRLYQVEADDAIGLRERVEASEATDEYFAARAQREPPAAAVNAGKTGREARSDGRGGGSRKALHRATMTASR